MIYRPGARTNRPATLGPRTRDILLTLQDIARVHSGKPRDHAAGAPQVRPGATSTPAPWGTQS